MMAALWCIWMFIHPIWFLIAILVWKRCGYILRYVLIHKCSHDWLTHLFFNYFQFFGACWYLLTVQRQDTCWQYYSANQTVFKKGYLDCSTKNNPERELWDRVLPQQACVSNDNGFNFGIYTNAITHNITSMDSFTVKYLYCFWWGLQNLRLDLFPVLFPAMLYF